MQAAKQFSLNPIVGQQPLMRTYAQECIRPTVFCGSLFRENICVELGAGSSSAAGTASAVPVFPEKKMADDINIRLVYWGRKRFVSASCPPPRVHTISKQSSHTMYEWFPLVSTPHVKNSQVSFEKFMVWIFKERPTQREHTMVV